MGVAEVLSRRSIDDGSVESLLARAKPEAAVNDQPLPGSDAGTAPTPMRPVVLAALVGAASGALAAVAAVVVYATLYTPLDQRVDPLAQRLLGLDGRVEQLATAIGPVQAELADLYDVTAGIAEHVAAEDGQAALLVDRFEDAIARQADAMAVGSPIFAVAVGQLRGVALTGAPFEAELVTAYTLGGDDPRVAGALAQLVAPSRSGIPSIGELQATLAASAATAGISFGADQGYYDYGVLVLSNYAGVTFEPYAIANARDLLGYAERRLNDSDVAGARDLLNRMDAEVGSAMGPWFEMADERLAAEAALASLTEVVVGTLSGKLAGDAAGTPAEGGANAE